MLVRWIRKDTSQLHDFDWEVSLIVPTPGGRRSVSVSASQARMAHHIFRECLVSCAVSNKCCSDSMIQFRAMQCQQSIRI